MINREFKKILTTPMRKSNCGLLIVRFAHTAWALGFPVDCLPTNHDDNLKIPRKKSK